MATGLNIPVLLITFNRPDTTLKVFEQIRKVKPKTLFISSDGARDNVSDERNVVHNLRELLLSKIDWDCNVKTKFNNHNMGCGRGVSSSITWFFEHCEEGIILEDDCVPSISFFSFCQKMIDVYRLNKSIWIISGFNPNKNSSDQFFLSKNPSVWGWATWRDRWQKYDFKINDWKGDINQIKGNNLPPYVSRYYREAFNQVKENKLDTWDYQLSFLILSMNGWTIKPYKNLIENIGVIGAHSTNLSINHFIKREELNEHNVNYTQELYYDESEDQLFYESRIKKTLLNRSKIFIYTFLQNILTMKFRI